MKCRIIIICLLSILTIIQVKAQPPVKPPIYLDDSQPLEVRVQDALSRMTLEEKVKLCHAQSKFSTSGCPRLGIPELWMSDGPHGVRAEINWNNWGYAGWANDSCTAFPALTCLAASWNPSLASKYGNAIGEEARYRKKDILLAPGVNIYRSPLNGRNFEYMGEDPYLASAICVPYIKAVQANGVSACVKHFALNNQEHWRDHIDVHLSDRALYEIYLPAFKAAVEKGGVWSIMGSYNKIRGIHATHNNLLNNDILKGEWNFDGCVISDWGAAHDTYQAAMNGLDIEMGTYTNGLTSESAFTYDDYYLGKSFLNMVKIGEIPESALDDKVARILRLTLRTAMNRQKPCGAMTTEEHYRVAREIASEGIVLLKNAALKRQGTLLPVVPGKYRHILVVGDNATRRLTIGGGSSELKVKKEVSPLLALKAKYGDCISYARGYTAGQAIYGTNVISPSTVDSLRADAVTKAANADLIVYIGGLNKNSHQDSEGDDRRDYALPFSQNQLIEELLKVNKNMVMVLISGNAVEMPWADKVPSILQAWYLGSISGEAITDVLSGEVNPSGKLPFSFPIKLTDCPAHAFGKISYPGDSISQEYKEDILVGYRWYDTKNVKMQFSFGHGLSYTTFQYGKAMVSADQMNSNSSINVRVKIKNTGKVAGKEVVQLYIGEEKCSVLRPVKELKGFQKIDLNPGEEKEITFTITVEDLKFFDDKKHKWVAEPGIFKAYIAASSADVHDVVPFEYK